MSSDDLVERQEFELYMTGGVATGVAQPLSQQRQLRVFSPLNRSSQTENHSRHAGRASTHQNQEALAKSDEKKPQSGYYAQRGSRADDTSTHFEDKLSSAVATTRDFKQSKANFNRTMISQSSMHKTIPRQTSALTSEQAKYASMQPRPGVGNQNRIT